MNASEKALIETALAEKALTEKPKRPGAPCSATVAVNSIEDPELRDLLAKALDGQIPEYKAPADAAALVEGLGFNMSAAIVRRHRRRLTGRGEKCWCPA